MAHRRTTFGPVTLPLDSEPVTDADEEIFLIYTDLQSAADGESGGSHGLGHLDARNDNLTVILELKAPLLENTPISGRRKGSGKRKGNSQPKDLTVEIELAQDTTALHSRKGDTGSVLWRASVEFARMVLQQTQFLDANADPVLNLTGMNVLELGAGTGLLSIALSSQTARYRATDIGPLIPLIRKNVSMNAALTSKVSVEELDWFALPARKTLTSEPPVDLILAVDCIYHPSLVPALVEAIELYTTPGHTAVLVVCELRAEDVLQTFLETWLSKGKDWQIWRVGRHGTLGRPFVIWMGWKSE